MKAYIYVNFVSGLGDTYTTILSALECSNELEEFGYETFLVLNTMRNQYLPSNVKLDCLFDFADFKNDVIYNPQLSSDGGLKIDGVDLIRLNQNQKSYEIYVDKRINSLKEYQSYIFGHTEINKNDRRPKCNTEIINKNILNGAKNFYDKIGSFSSLHYRAIDGLGDSLEYFNDKIKILDDFVTANNHETVLVFSNGKLIRNHLSKKFSNTKSFIFTHKSLSLFPCYDIYVEKIYPEYVFIEHAQEVLLEMVIMKYSNKIFSVSPFLSNFVTYGIINNVQGKEYYNFFEHHY